ncbi:MAG TPA: TetR/AcrR family transcriptional regulator C-terminal domain-containing protein [Euzebya sp.]|nr:TetR/AcrR family transcriptional regulator C-terminal domain-containing protein [Euzebya sp.]
MDPPDNADRWPPPRTESSAGREDRGDLSTDSIVEAAMRVAMRDSLDALSLRKVARELDRAPMSLYRHISDVNNLVALVVERLVAQMQVTDHGEDWRGTLTDAASALRALLTQHPGIVAVVMRSGITSPALLQHINTVFGALVRSGLPDDEVVEAHAALMALTFGSAVLRRSVDEAFPDATEDAMAHRTFLQQLRDAGGADHTHIAAVADAWLAMDHDVAFRFALDLLLDGIAGRTGT